MVQNPSDEKDYMGVTIKYRGKISDKTSVFSLIDEIEDIAKTQNWPYQILDEDWAIEPNAKLESGDGSGIQIIGHTGLKGLRFKPHSAGEDIWLYFNKSGILTTPFRIALDAEENYPQRKSWVSSNTKNADVDTHLKIINIFRYLKKKYLHDLELRDETGYWENEDLNQLKKYYQVREIVGG